MIIKPRFQLYVSRSHIKSAGRGVFAGEDIALNSIIETCPVLVVPRKDYPILKKTELRNYYFMWGKVTVGICFGYGPMYNHSYTPNATYKKNIQDQTIDFIAIKVIRKDEEITVNYNYGKPDSRQKLWIKSINRAT